MGEEEGESGVCDEPNGGMESRVVVVLVRGWSSYWSFVKMVVFLVVGIQLYIAVG